MCNASIIRINEVLTRLFLLIIRLWTFYPQQIVPSGDPSMRQKLNPFYRNIVIFFFTNNENVSELSLVKLLVT